MSNPQPLVTVFTCVYNGSKTIHRVFKSMKAQTYRNLEHVIVDDGSTDFDLVQPMLDEYVASVPFPVKVVRKTNGGKHTAHNAAMDNTSGEFMIGLDADDELLPHGIDFLVKSWFEIPEDVRKTCWCIQGRCIDERDGKLIGPLYPENVNDLPLRECTELIRKHPGEKIGLRLSKVVCQFRFPEPVGVNFVTESVLWNQIHYDWRTWCTNEPVRVFYIHKGNSLSRPKLTKQSFSNRAYNNKWAIERRKEYPMSFVRLTRATLVYSLCYACAKKEYRKNNSFFLKNSALINFVLTLLFLPSCFARLFFALTHKE